MILYGINNCDTVRKARRWLEQQQLDVPFHDFRLQGLDKAQLSDWVERIGWETLLNKRSTSYRNLEAQDKEAIDTAKAIALMLAHPTLIKRPVLVTDNSVLVGFSPQLYQENLCE